MTFVRRGLVFAGASLLLVAGCAAGPSVTPAGATTPVLVATPSAATSSAPTVAPTPSPTGTPTASPSPSAPPTPAITVPIDTPTPSASAVVGVPVQDAAAFRDDLLALARAVPFDASKLASQNATSILNAWFKKYPTLEPSLFSSQEATPTRLSIDLSFLIVRTPGTWDQALSFAILDSQGRCGAGAAIIPGGATAVSESTVPTKFVAVDIPAGKPCSAGTVNEVYKPGS